MSDVAATETLDVKGLLCPMPILKLSKFAKKLDKGTIVKVIATDLGTIADIPAWARQKGAEVLNIQEGEEIEFLVRL